MIVKKKPILGIDLGGTKIMTGIISPEGKVIGVPFFIPTGGQDPKEDIVNRIVISVKKALDSAHLQVADIEGIGIGATGPLDMKGGLILECPFLPTMHYFPLRKVIQEKFGIPVFIDNDANCFVLGECYYGAGRGHKIVMGYTLGTGLGCATVINKQIFRGSTQHACEVWPSPFRDQTIEDYVSGRGIARIYKDISNNEKSSYEIAQLAFRGDDQAIKSWQQFGESLAFAISWGINVIDPEVVIIGGSIAKAMNLFFETLLKYVKKYICSVPAEKMKVMKTQLGDNAGFIGAACLVLQTD